MQHSREEPYAKILHHFLSQYRENVSFADQRADPRYLDKSKKSRQAFQLVHVFGYNCIIDRAPENPRLKERAYRRGYRKEKSANQMKFVHPDALPEIGKR